MKPLRFRTSLLVATLVFLPQSPFAQWTQQAFPTSENLWKVRFIDMNTGWVLGHEHMYKTSDGGITWMEQDATNGGGYALYPIDENIVVYSRWHDEPEILRRSIDGGITWETVDTLTFFYTDFVFLDDVTGFAAGGIPVASGIYQPSIRKTTDAGASWTTLWTDSTGNYEFEAISFADALNAWVVTYDGNVFASTDGGNTWTFRSAIQPVPPPGFIPTRDVRFTLPSEGCVVGGLSGDMLTARTTDGGYTWTHFQTFGASLREIAFSTPDVAWIVGANYDPNISRTTDGGISWETQTLEPGSSIGLESIAMIDDNVGWTVGGGGKIYKTTNGGVTSVKEGGEIPNDFALSQNYPNPFNPHTEIGFRSPVAGYVSLRVYNLLGMEVATLVNERKSPGKYTIMWNAEELPSGVYIYRLNAGNVVESRKAVLLK